MAPAALPQLRIGTAGWSIPAVSADAFPGIGTHLERYGALLRAAEINSSFHRPHRASTYVRWRESVPDHFRFSVKLPKAITHKARLAGAELPLKEFFRPVQELGGSLGCILVQLPPSLTFDEAVSTSFFTSLRWLYDGPVACEPRNETWFTPEVSSLLAAFRVSRVIADPAKTPAAAEPGGFRELRYYRLHGSPRMYYSSYEQDYLLELTARIREEMAGTAEMWCIFDNTTLGAALPNALDLLRMLESAGSSHG